MKILFVSGYTEVLKTFIPLIKYFNKYDIFVIAKYFPNSPDYENSKIIIEDNRLNACLRENEEFYSKNHVGYIARIIRTMKVKRSAYNFYEKTNPDIIILGPDKNAFERFLIKRAKKDSIPSISIQWSLGPITKKSFIETKQKKLFNEIKNIKVSKIRKFIKVISRSTSSILHQFLGLRTPEYAACYGGGDSTYLAAIGKTSKSFYSSMGVDNEKIIITGHPLLEKTYYTHSKGPTNVYNLLNIPINSNYILFCTAKHLETSNDYLLGKSILEWRREKINSILETKYKGYIVVKLHPVEKIDNFKTLENISDRVKLAQGIDVIDLIKYCDIFLTRYSTSAYYAMMCHRPVITHNYPPVPFGSYFDEIGGSLHVDNKRELMKNIDLINNRDKTTLQLIEKRKIQFLQKHLNIDVRKIINQMNVMPSLYEYESLINKVTAKI
jgi:CDP-glycerol glycerophosphotransferase (TagB/SpsB family)